MPYSARYLVRQWIHISVKSAEAPRFHALREGGPRFLGSIPSCARGFSTDFTQFNNEGGLAPEVDPGYTFMRQSTVTFGRISHSFLMNVDTDPVDELSK